MMMSGYLHARAAMRCLNGTEPTQPELLIPNVFFRCMCDLGIISYCSRISVESTESSSFDEETTETEWSFSDSFQDPVTTMKNGVWKNDEPSLNFNADDDVKSAPDASLDTIVTCIGVFSIILCVSYIIFRCFRQGVCPDPAGLEVAAPMLSGCRRSGGAAAAASTTNDVTPGGGGGGGQGETAAPVDLPPPYDLVYEENITPPTYEEVIREEAKDGDRDPV